MPIRMIAASGQLGYGFNEESFNRALSLNPDFIGCDGGSMDPGPWYLGAGKPFVAQTPMNRDLRLLLRASVARKIPLVIGSAGGGGGAPHVALVQSHVEAIAREEGLTFNMAVIQSEQAPHTLSRALDEGRIQPLGPIDQLTQEQIRKNSRVVAMMGAEPLQHALEQGADVVIAGRCTDAAIYSAIPLMKGYDPGLVWHLAKVVECGAQIIEPRTSQDCVVGTLFEKHFEVEPGASDRACTKMRVAAHTLYENPSPYELKEPAGTLSTRSAQYEQIDDRCVRVSGSEFIQSDQYTVKLEGVEPAGFRTVFVAGVRDPVLVSTIDEFVANCHDRVAIEMRSLDIDDADYTITVRTYGRDAVMGLREPVQDFQAHELGLVVEALGVTEDISRTAMAKVRYALLHTDFPGRMCISGNLAIPFSPSDMYVGETWKFSVWHTMAVDDPLALFPMKIFKVG